MREDEVMTELRAIRAAYSKRFGYDLRKMVADLQKQDAHGSVGKKPARSAKKRPKASSNRQARPIKGTKPRRAA